MLLSEKKAAGILVIVNKNDNSTQYFNEFLYEISSSAYDFPIYFAYETPELLLLYNQMKTLKPQLLSEYDSIQLHLNVDEEAERAQITLTNYFDILPIDDTERAPVILVLAHYDAMTIAPEFSFALDASGSGAISILEISRRTKKLIKEMKQIAHHDVIFALTSGSMPNFEGANEFFRKLDEQLAKRVSFVICIDSIGNSNSLYAHVHGKAENPQQNMLLETLTESSKISGINMQIITEPMSDNHVWEGEVFAKMQLFSLTLSEHKTIDRSKQMAAELYDGVLDQKALNKNIDAITDYLVRVVCSLATSPNGQISLTSKSDGDYIGALADYLKNHSRYPYQLAKDSKGLKDFEKVIA